MTVCVYSPAQEDILRDNTIVFVIGALHTPAGNTAMIDANQRLIPFASDPAHDDYEKSVLDQPYLHVVAIGKVTSHTNLADDDTTRSFNIAVSEWVINSIKPCTLKYVFNHYLFLGYFFKLTFNTSTSFSCKIDSKLPWWKKTWPPGVGHFVKVEGFCTHIVKPSKVLGITISHLLYHPGGSSNQPESSSGQDISPSKKRKFDPFVSTITPAKLENITPVSSLPDVGMQDLQDSIMDISAPEQASSSNLLPLPISSSTDAGPSSKKRGKRKATDVTL